MNATMVFEGIRDGNFHKGGIRCLQLFDLEASYFSKLRCDVERLCETERPSNVSDAKHVTNWTRPRGTVLQFSLLNRSGRYDDFADDHDMSCLGKTFHGATTYLVLANFVAAFPHMVNCRINMMGPGARLSPHEEQAIIRTRTGSVATRTRFHLPLVTNPLAELTLDEAVYHLPAGKVYFVNHGCVHSAHNRGKQDRIHLVWDMLLTYEAFQLMFSEEPCPGPLSRVSCDEQVPHPLRNEKMGAYLQLPRLVTLDEAKHIEWCDVQ